MASADQIYVDPSALLKLYLHQNGSREMVRWRSKISGPLLITHHGRAEVVNAVAMASFLGELNEIERTRTLERLNDDFIEGHLKQADLLWRAALNRAADLSQRFTPQLGTRTLDVLHVACAMELNLPHFLTFDQKQQKLAAATGLKLVRISY